MTGARRLVVLVTVRGEWGWRYRGCRVQSIGGTMRMKRRGNRSYAGLGVLRVAAVAVVAAALWRGNAAASVSFSWAQRAASGPSPRAEFGLAYDSAREVTVLFGGANNLSFTSVFPDTWEWDG